MLNVDPAHSPANVGNVAARLGGEAQAAKNEKFQRFFREPLLELPSLESRRT